MKWTNPGHQLDGLGARLLKVKNLYLYGVDGRAKDAYDFLQWLGVSEEFNISFVLDITVLNQEGSVRSFCGKRVIAFQTELCDEMSAAPEESLVALPYISQTAEREILSGLGIENIYFLSVSFDRRDNFIQNFVCVWFMYRHHKLVVHSQDYILTSRCNLNCKYCANFTEYIEKPYEMSFEEFKASIDAFFRKVDYLYSFHFCGGEPLLGKDLLKCIRYMEKYRDRIFDLYMITNGTILPTEEVAAAMKALEGHFLIDDYSLSISNAKIAEIKDRLESHGVGYSVNAVDHWYNFDVLNTDNNGMSEDELERWRDGCNTFLYTLGEKKLYACCYAKYAERAGLNTIDPDDYIEIEGTSKMEFLEFIQGYTRRGYVSLCTHCLGLGGHAKRVAPAIQIPPQTGGTEKLSERAGKGPLVSVCVPVYNTGKYLVRCLRSLIGQTYSNLEILLVDDGSTDNCGLICDEFAVLDPRVSVIHKPNGGEASARNAGLTAAVGEYVMFIDSDDEYLPDAVQRLVDTAAMENTDLVIGGYLERRGDVERFATGHRRRYRVADLAHVYLTTECSLDLPYIATTVNAKLFRNALIRDNHISFDERFVIGNDAVFICEYLRCAETVCDILAPIYVYYKFDPAERLQGMGWYYPDTVFLFAYVADQMLKLTRADTAESRQIIAKQYRDFLYGLMNAAVNRDHLEDNLLLYLTRFCKMDLVQNGSRLDLEYGLKVEEGGLPTRLLSFLIMNKRYQELCDLLRELGKNRGVVPYQGKWVRQMIRLGGERDLAFTGTDEKRPIRCAAEDAVLLKQVDELVQNFASGQRAVKECEARASGAEVRASEAEARANEAEARASGAEVRASEAEARANEAEARASEAEARANEAEARASGAEARANEAEARASEAEARASEAEAQLRLAQAESSLTKAQLDEITHSRSWRFTEPCRALMRRLHSRQPGA